MGLKDRDYYRPSGLPPSSGNGGDPNPAAVIGGIGIVVAIVGILIRVATAAS